MSLSFWLGFVCGAAIVGVVWPLAICLFTMWLVYSDEKRPAAGKKGAGE